MIELQKFEVLAVRAAINALVIVYAKQPKGRKRLNEAIALLREQSIAAHVLPISRAQRTLDRALLDESVLYLETIKDMLDEGRV